MKRRPCWRADSQDFARTDDVTDNARSVAAALTSTSEQRGRRYRNESNVKVDLSQLIVELGHGPIGRADRRAHRRVRGGTDREAVGADRARRALPGPREAPGEPVPAGRRWRRA